MPRFTISNQLYYTILYPIFQPSTPLKRLHQDLQGIFVTKLFKSDRMNLSGKIPK